MAFCQTASRNLRTCHETFSEDVDDSKGRLRFGSCLFLLLVLDFWELELCPFMASWICVTITRLSGHDHMELKCCPIIH